MTDFADKAMVFKAFCDESRLAILKELKDGERCACHLLEAMPISQSTLSHHMKILVESGVVEARREGRWVHYSLGNRGIDKAINYMQMLIEAEATECASKACGRNKRG